MPGSSRLRVGLPPVPSAPGVAAVALAAMVWPLWAWAGGEAALVWPTQGRPAFVRPGGTLSVVVVAPEAVEVGAAEFALVATAPPAHRHVLKPSSASDAGGEGGGTISLAVPEGVPRQTYDLEVRLGARVLRGVHAVSVTDVGPRVRLVHLSDMNVGDPCAPDFDPRLVEEVNLVTPTLIVATGDYFDAASSPTEHDWRRLSAYLAGFDAPVLMACGDHDDVELFSRFAAPSPVGLIDLGSMRGAVLLDHRRLPIDRDAQQVAWIEGLLDAGDGPTFIVSHDDPPGLMRHWLNRGALARRAGAGRIRAWFVGGRLDWDGREQRGLVDGARPVRLIRTHQSSAAALEGAEGVSHYRIVDLVDGRVVEPHDRTAAPAADAPPSLAVGRLGVVFDGANDGSRSRVAFTVVNGHGFRIDGLSVRVLLRREGDSPPWCRGGTLAQLVAFARVWECRVSLDLADRGVCRVVVGTGEPPAASAPRVAFDAPSAIVLEARETPEGVRFLSSTSQPVLVLSQSGQERMEVLPRVRLDGSNVAYRPAEGGAPFALAHRVELRRDAPVRLVLDLSVLRVRPGRRELQVYADGFESTPVCYPLDLVVEEGRAGDARRAVPPAAGDAPRPVR